jgi:predicted nucleic acid-binding protein
LAYYVLKTTPFSVEASNLFRSNYELSAPASWHTEFLHVVWRAIRSGGFSLYHGLELLEGAEGLLDRSAPLWALWREALVIADDHHCNTCDTLFVALAEREHCSLLTYDQKLLTAFPETVRLPAQVLSP